MRKIAVILLVFFALTAIAQTPSNDNCNTPIALGKIPACPTTLFSNLNATPSAIGSNNNNICKNDGNVSRDVWFTFQTSNTIFDYNINVKSTDNQGIKSPNISIFRGDCGINSLARLCIDTSLLSSDEMSINAFGLTKNVTYFIRVSDSQAAGNFSICVSEFKISTMSNATVTSCAGTIYDSGGPDKSYKSGENLVLKICPTDAHKCIKFTLNNYNIGADADQIKFFNGADTTAPLIRAIYGENFDGGGFNAGGAGFEVYASATCLTVQFKSDSTNNYEGFEGKWQCSSEACPTFNSLEITPASSKEAIETAVARSGTDVKLKEIKCGTGLNNYGIFKATDNSELGLGSGIVLSSGSIDKINQPADILSSTSFKIKGDADLDALSLKEGGSPSKDACVMEFEVFANTDEINFDYIFGSEEYPRYISDPNFFDIFALMIEGQGIVPDTEIKPKKNLAVLPDGTQISIGQVNSSSNYEYYRNNFDGKTIVYNGLTTDKNGSKKVLTAKSKVIPCQTYKLKMAIADRGDENFDSGVFIGDIRGATPEIVLNSAINLDYLAKECSGNQEQIKIKLSRALTEKVEFVVTLSGTAILGVDYNTTLPNVVTFPAGTTELSFPINLFANTTINNNKYVEISLSRNYGCGLVKVATKKILIKENLELKLNIVDTVTVCADLVKSKGINVVASGATSYEWLPNNSFAEPKKAKTIFTPSVSGWYYVTGKSNNCTVTDSFYARLILPSLKIKALSKTTICEGETISLQAQNNFGSAGLQWFPNLNFSSITTEFTTLKPNFSNKAYVKATISGCEVIDTLSFVVNRVGMPKLIQDTTICFKDKIELASVTFAPNTTFTWSPSGPSNPAVNSVFVTPTKSTTYILKATTDKCIIYDTVNVKVVGKLAILGKDTIRICKGTPLSLEAETDENILPKDINFSWSSKIATFSDEKALKTIVTVEKSGWIFTKANASKCNLKDSIFVIMDSLPNDLTLNVFKKKPFYCIGDTILLYSNGSMPKNLYPNATFSWENPLGAISPTDKANLKFLALKPNDYIRFIKNGVCERRDTFKAIVLQKLPDISINDVSICANEKATLEIKNAADFENFEWKPADKLSCSDCAKPTTNSPGTYNIIASKAGFCPSMKTVNVVLNIPKIKITASKSIFCDSEKLEANLNVTGATDIIWSPADGLSCTNCMNPIATKAGIYIAKLNSKLCNISDTISIKTIQIPIDLSTAGVICDNGKTSVTLRNSEQYNTFSITPKDNITIDKNNITISKSGFYTIDAVSKIGNCPYTNSFTVKAGVKPSISILAKPGVLTTNGKSVELEAIGTNLNEATLLWQDARKGKNFTATPTIFETNYFVSGESNDGCKSQDTITIYNVVVPSIILADATDGNEKFGIINLPSDNIATFKELKIFDRWGNLVFQTTDKNETWKGENSPSDVYVYYFMFEMNITKKLIIGKGNVTLIR